jgi:Tfp pilus assembly protein PilO
VFAQGLVWALWFFVVHPWHEHAALQEQQKKQQTHLEQTSYERTQQELVRLRQQKKSFEQELNAALQQQPINGRMQHIIADLERNGLALQTLAKQDVQEQDWYNVLQVTVDAQGTFEQIVQFLRQLKERTSLLDIAGITLQRVQTGAYKLTMRLLLYEFKKSPSTLKKAEGLGG